MFLRNEPEFQRRYFGYNYLSIWVLQSNAGNSNSASFGKAESVLEGDKSKEIDERATQRMRLPRQLHRGYQLRQELHWRVCHGSAACGVSSDSAPHFPTVLGLPRKVHHGVCASQKRSCNQEERLQPAMGFFVTRPLRIAGPRFCWQPQRARSGGDCAPSVRFRKC